MSARQWTALLVGVAALACDNPVGAHHFAPPDRSDPPGLCAPAGCRIQIASGNGQVGKAGEWLSESLQVRVTDGRGHSLRWARVTWDASPGAGLFLDWSDWEPEEVESFTQQTDTVGMSSVSFLPTAVGSVTATARAVSAGGASIGSVAFQVETTALVIAIDHCDGSSLCFVGPRGTTSPSVPVGVPVEWVNRGSQVATVTSSTVPVGGSSFDSGPLSESERFEFVPGVAGTWEYVDEIGGAKGALTAR